MTELRFARTAITLLAVMAGCASPITPTPTPSGTPMAVRSPETSSPRETSTPLTGWVSSAGIEGVRLDLDAVVQFGGRLFAAGAMEHPDGDEPVVLASSDGVRWEVEADGDDFGGAVFFLDISASEGGLVVIGSDASTSNLQVAAWYSDDGTSWIRSTPPAEGRTQAVGVAERNGVWVIGATLEASSGETAQGALVWSSTDGRTWRHASGVEIAAEYGSLSSLASSPDRFVAIGDEYLEPPPTRRTWMSTDGQSWQLVAKPASLLSSTQLRFVDGAFVALGVSAGYWVETIAVGGVDGVAWRQVDLSGFYMTRDVVRAGEKLVLTGVADDQGSLAVAVADDLDGPWARQPVEALFDGFFVSALTLSPDGSTLVAVGSSDNGFPVLTVPLR